MSRGALLAAASALALALPAAAQEPAAPPAAQAAPTAPGAPGAGGPPRGRGGPRAEAPVVQPPAAPPDPAAVRFADAAQARDWASVKSLLAKGGQDVNALGSDGTPALHWAIRAGDVEMTKALIAAGADPKRPNRYELAPIVIAAENGDAEMLKALIAAGADANTADRTGESVLMIATREGTPAAVKTLLDAGAKVDTREPKFQQTALMLAVRGDHTEVVDLLVKAKADVNVRTRVAEAPAARPPGAGGGSHGDGIVRGGIPDQGARAAQPGGMTPLLYAARDGRADAAKLLIAAGAKLELADANDMSPLAMALLNGKLPTAKLLIEAGANVNSVDWYGRTPLLDAVEIRNLEVNGPTKANGVDRPAALELIKLLLDKGANPNARTKEYPPDRRFITGLGSLAWVDFTGKTPFIQAALSGDVDTMRLLLKYKANPKITTVHGTNALMAAAGVNWVFNQTWDEGQEKLLEAVKLCVELGMDVNATNSMGLAAVHGAANRGSDGIIGYLVTQGARLDVKDAVGRTPMTWAEGVFLATNAPEPKPTTIALIKDLTSKGMGVGKPQQASGKKPQQAQAKPARTAEATTAKPGG